MPGRLSAAVVVSDIVIVTLPRQNVGAQCWRVGEYARQRWRFFSSGTLGLRPGLCRGFAARWRGGRFVVFQCVLDPRLLVRFFRQFTLLPLDQIGRVHPRSSSEGSFGTTPMRDIGIDCAVPSYLRSEVEAVQCRLKRPNGRSRPFSFDSSSRSSAGGSVPTARGSVRTPICPRHWRRLASLCSRTFLSICPVQYCFR